MCWTVVELKNKNVPIFGVSRRLTRSTKVYVDWEGECQHGRGGMLVGWWFSSHAASIKNRSRKIKTSVVRCWMLQASAVDVLVSGSFLSVWTLKRISSFIVLPSPNLINFRGLFFLGGVPWRSWIGRKITFNSIFYDNSINISPCVKLMCRDVFFYLKNLCPGNIWWALSSPQDWRALTECLYDKSEKISISHIITSTLKTDNPSSDTHLQFKGILICWEAVTKWRKITAFDVYFQFLVGQNHRKLKLDSWV